MGVQHCCSTSGGHWLVSYGQHFKIQKKILNRPTTQPCFLPPWWPQTGKFFGAAQAFFFFFDLTQVIIFATWTLHIKAVSKNIIQVPCQYNSWAPEQLLLQWGILELKVACAWLPTCCKLKVATLAHHSAILIWRLQVCILHECILSCLHWQRWEQIEDLGACSLQHLHGSWSPDSLDLDFWLLFFFRAKEKHLRVMPQFRERKATWRVDISVAWPMHSFLPSSRCFFLFWDGIS